MKNKKAFRHSKPMRWDAADLLHRQSKKTGTAAQHEERTRMIKKQLEAHNSDMNKFIDEYTNPKGKQKPVTAEDAYKILLAGQSASAEQARNKYLKRHGMK